MTKQGKPTAASTRVRDAAFSDRYRAESREPRAESREPRAEAASDRHVMILTVFAPLWARAVREKQP